MKRKKKERGRREIEFSTYYYLDLAFPIGKDIHQGLGHVLATYSCRLNLLPGSSLQRYIHNSLAIPT